ncbi:MAG: adenylyltransferase/cytidyltransferase family protein [Armatimonadetes bacterium]|nr:adenylyltransferase/cytidyltransferase family protein [Candidatus Hippobium faecium]
MKKYKIGMTVGVFDLFHEGHLNLLERCKEQCEYLIVGILSDEHVKNTKHKDTVFPQNVRHRIIDALKVVDETVDILPHEVTDRVALCQRVPFDVLFNGSDWIGSERFAKIEKDLKEINVPIVYFPYTQGISSTEIKDKMNKLNV